MADQFFTLADLGLVTSTSQNVQQWLASMQAQYPGYSPSSGNQEYVQAQIVGSFASALGALCSAGGVELFNQYALQLFNISVQNGSIAAAVVTITAVDTAGYTLAAGTQVTLTLAGVQMGFATANPLVIPPGSSTGNVTVTAVSPGIAFNGAGAPAQLINALTWVTGVTVVSAASAGADPEDPDHYLQRVKKTFKLFAPRPITAQNFGDMALDFPPDPTTAQQTVGRATAIDGYDPVANTYNNPRNCTVCVTDANGQPLSGLTIAAVKAWFQTLREITFIVNVVSPNYSTVYVTCQVHPATGFTGATVQAAVQAALLAYLTPANFGLPSQSLVGWQNTPTVYRSVVEAIIQNTPGVAYYVPGSVAIDVNPTPTNTTNDLQLPGAFPLPTTSTASIPLTAIQAV